MLMSTVCSVTFIKWHCYFLICGLFVHNLSLALGSLRAEPELGLSLCPPRTQYSFLQQISRDYLFIFFTGRWKGNFSSVSSLTCDLSRPGWFVLLLLWWYMVSSWLSFRWQQLCLLSLGDGLGLGVHCSQWGWWLPGYLRCDEGHASFVQV